MNSDRYLATPMGFARVNFEPLDKYEVFETMADFLQYVKSGPAYPGQICKVIHRDSPSPVILEYLIGVDNKITPLYPGTVEENIINYYSPHDLSGNDPAALMATTNIDVNTNGKAPVKWLLVYNYTSDLKFTGNMDFNNDAFSFSCMGNVPIYRCEDKYFYFLAIIGTTLYVWKQYIDPLSNEIPPGCEQIETKLSIDIDNKTYKMPFRYCPNTSVTIPFGLFPMVGGTSKLSLYIGIF